MARTDVRGYGVSVSHPEPAADAKPPRNVLDCGGKRSATPLWQPTPAVNSGVAASLCHRSPYQQESASGLGHHKTWRHALGFLAVLMLAGAALAQSYSIDWSKVAGGGGTSTGGVYAVSGTLGQPDAGGPLTNGQYSVTGGFWALPVAVQTPEAPVLSTAAATPGQVRISWTPPTPGYSLQSTDSLSPPNWLATPSGTNNPAIVPASAASRFYRLQKVGP